MTRNPVTVTEDQMQLIEGATAIGLHPSRSAFLREAFREYFAENEVLLAILLATVDDVDARNVVTTVGANPDGINALLSSLGSPVDEAASDSIMEEIQEEFDSTETNGSS